LRIVGSPPVSHRPQGGGSPKLDIDKDPRAAALEQGLDCPEDEAIRRAFEGSDRLLIYVLNRRRPEVYSAHRAKSQVVGTTRDMIDFNGGRWLPRVSIWRMPRWNESGGGSGANSSPVPW
jgi:hypothetical protein